MISLTNLYVDLQQNLSALRQDRSRVENSHALVLEIAESDTPHYGINTGFGVLKGEKIGRDEIGLLQKNLLLSHAVGVGPIIPRQIAKLVLQLKICSLGLGYSGVSAEIFDRLLTFDELDLVPAIPQRGSVGASGDLAPLAHMSLPLIGLGEFQLENGTRIPAADVLAEHQLETVQLSAKDGLSLTNGTQFMTAYAAHVLHRALALVTLCDVVATMSLEALQGSIVPFDERIHALRNHPGQLIVAGNIRQLLDESEILEAHRNCGKVQDPYSLRCVPQVHGASRDALMFANQAVETELNSVTDNPLVFEDGSVLSGGNFHGQPIAMALDLASIALAELASISERRTYLLLSGHDGLPLLLMKNTGVNSGFMIPQYTAAALVSENKVLCHPAVVDSIPTSLGQEDHVSMGSVSATKLLTVLENLEHVIAIELLTAAQALDYRKPLSPGKGVTLAHDSVREAIPHRESDYLFQEDLVPALALVRDGVITDLLARRGFRLN